MRYFIISLLTLVPGFLLSCKENSVAKESEYAIYLTDGILPAKVEKVETEKKFWKNRLDIDTGSFINKLELARNELALFKLNGDIKALKRGDSLLVSASAKLHHTDPELLFALSQNSITQHQFRRAASFNQQAEKMNGDMYTVRLLQFDACMELGRYNDAYKSLQSLKDRSSFDYLVRKAKWEDHNGRLEQAISLMEQALELVRNKKRSHHTWALSNLADMYGHAGRIRKSYKAYLDVLALDPSNLYCLKGIAWIAYSHDQNFSQAKRILEFILTQTEMPELKLVLAEIAELENEPKKAVQWKSDFISDVTGPGYGEMYNKYLIEIYAGNKEEQLKSLALAEKEINERFTVETADALAWVHYKRGNFKEAMNITESYVAGRSYEPAVQMHTAFIYAANGKKKEARSVLEDCLESSFELGPLSTREIREKLDQLKY